MQPSRNSRIQQGRRLRREVLTALATTPFLASAALCQLATPPAHPLPAAQPTQIQSYAAPQPVPATTAQPYRARVELLGNQLTLAAQNSSLNEILRDIAKLTGMKITGGVADERVYGNYGPDTAQAILDELLDGTGTNMVLLETSRHTIAELILTPRNGGPTPPSPSASRDSGDEDSLPPTLPGRRRDFPSSGRHIPFNQDLHQIAPLSASPAQQQLAFPTNGDASVPQDTSQPSPNGVKTPREVFLENQGNQPQPQQSPTTPPR